MSPRLWFRVVSLGALLLILASLPGLARKPDAQARGKKYALLVGVTGYKGDKFSTLRYTENDVEALAKLLTQAGFDGVRVLTNKRGENDAADAPTAANIKKAIDALAEDRGKRDTVLVALSGHGANV